MQLAELERQFQAFVLEHAAGIERAVVGTARVPAATRLAIYSDAYRARLAEALENNYPVLAQLLGARQFGELAQAYIATHPSQHFSIRWYGAQLPQFLAAHDPYRSTVLLTDLARFEWNMTLAFDAANAPVLERSALAALSPEDWPELRLRLHPSARLVTLSSEAPAVWRALNRNEAPPQDTLAGEAASPQAWVLWRRGLDTFFRSLDPGEAAALAALADGGSFAQACEALAQQRSNDVAAEAAGLLARWLEDEMFAAP